MMDEEEKKIKALELEHQEVMTRIHTLSWIIFTIFVMAFVLTFSGISETIVANILMGVISMFALIILSFAAYIT